MVNTLVFSWRDSWIESFWLQFLVIKFNEFINKELSTNRMCYSCNVRINFKTGKHCSMMRTSRLLTVYYSIHVSWGRGLPNPHLDADPSGCKPPGGRPPGGTQPGCTQPGCRNIGGRPPWRQTLPHYRQTLLCPKLPSRAVKIKESLSQLSIYVRLNLKRLRRH